MSLVLDSPSKKSNPSRVDSTDRPGWIPDNIIENWDISPYAYQTEEELMPAGGPHGRLLEHILNLISHMLEPKGLMLLMDTFMLYRDEDGIKQRVSPDLLLMPYRVQAPSAYDLDSEAPPLMTVEVTSPKSAPSDLHRKNIFYLSLGIQTYLVIDSIQPNAKPREQIRLYLWRQVDGEMQQMATDEEGYLLLPEMGLGIMAQNRELFFKDMVTGEIARDAGHLSRTVERQQQEIQVQQQEIERQVKALAEERRAKEEERRAKEEERRAKEEERRAKEEERRAKEEERLARLRAEEENVALRAELERLRQEQGK